MYRNIARREAFNNEQQQYCKVRYKTGMLQCEPIERPPMKCFCSRVVNTSMIESKQKY